MELLDVVDENNNLTGIILDRKEIHEKKLFHRHVSCWIINREGKILLQQRSLNKKKNPGKWAKTGGHVDSGESPIDAIKREVYEEINLSAQECEIIKGDIFKSRDKLEPYYAYNYIFITDKKEDEFILQKDEVEKVKYYTISDLEKLKKENNEDYTFYKWSQEDFDYEMKNLRKIIKERL